MKAIKKERTTTTEYTVYVANDGTEFTKEELCKIYEDSLACLLNMRFQPLAKKLHGDAYNHIDNFMDSGCRTATYYLVSPKNMDEVNTICMWVKDHDGYFADPAGKYYDACWNVAVADVVPGKSYIIIETDSGYVTIYGKERVERGMLKALAVFDAEEDSHDDNEVSGS